MHYTFGAHSLFKRSRTNMIIFSKQQFEDKRIGVVITIKELNVHFKLVELLRILFDTTRNTDQIPETCIKVFNEFPNTKYITMGGLMTLADNSPKRQLAQRVQYWAQELSWWLRWSLM